MQPRIKNKKSPTKQSDPVDNNTDDINLNTSKNQSNYKEIDKKQKIYLVTGPSSGIGIEVIKSLTQDKNNIVRVLIRAKPQVSQSWKKLPRGTIPYVVDITLKNEEDKKSLEEACSNVDMIIHLASIRPSNKTKDNEYLDVNVIGTENILRTWLNANSNNNINLKIIYLSSTAVYGNKRKSEILDEDSQLKPSNSYGASKMMGEDVIKAYAVSNSRIKYTILRAPTIYGTHYEESFFKVFKLLLENRMRYIGSGDNHMTLIHIKDLVNAINLSLTNPNSDNKIYNVTDGNEYTQKFLVHKAAKYLNVDPPKKSINAALARIVASMFNLDKSEFDFLTSDRIIDISKIKNELNFVPKEDLNSATKELIDEFLKTNKKYIKVD